ncbi:serine hydrolase [Microbacterium sp.]|uniref:serine hydrolase domain-containing protein n=1 Tax=Microbacterium sp. TaxID=51671 RepID=UPI001AC9F06F|nr:serine hydrolase domain-containing protein [Microbacterium sp.]MBN9185176.1 beta-lactamase family protein [Microbacterium sp.]MBN9192537.1 beta-lactamase family protein [Microbacterium sp.]
MSSSVEGVRGDVAEGFGAVHDAFRDALAGDAGSGAALSIRRDGELVVDLAGGVAQPRTGAPWTLDTPSVIFSCTKGLMSVLVARLVEEGRLGYATPVAELWPEFAAAGKEGATVRDAVSHRAGLPAPRTDWTPADILDWDRATALLAAETPLFAPGSAWSYHAITHGWLTGELVRRVTGETPGAYFARTVTGPLGADAWIGLPAAEQDRVAHLQVGGTLAALVAEQRAAYEAGASVWPYRAMTLGGALPPELVGEDAGFNRADVRAAQIPGAGGVSTAHALATIWSAVVAETGGVRLLGDEILTRATEVQSEGAPYFPVPWPWPRWGMGFQLDSEARRYLGSSSLGHDGAGGQVAFADRDAKVGFAFLTNRMEAVDDRATRIVDALRAVL